jgi:ubiquitin C-terminal hydrolase
MGHYTAYVNSNGRWLNYNDTQTYEIEQADITKNNAYILFYIRK